MKTAAPPVFPLLRSDLQARILSRAFLGGKEESVVDLAAAIEADPGNTAREVTRLENAGILVSRRIGRNKLVRVNDAAPFFQPLRDLITIVLGPPTVLAEYLETLPGLESAEIFGSWAARVRGESGPPPADIDLLVIGEPDRDDLYEALQEASRRLNLAVTPVVMSKHRWEKSDEGFVVELRSRPRVSVLPKREGET